jgi:hypothetical protein
MSRFRITIAVHELSCALIHFSHARPAQERLTDTILDDQNTKMLHSHLFLPQVNMLYRNAAGHTIVYNVVLLYSEKRKESFTLFNIGKTLPWIHMVFGHIHIVTSAKRVQRSSIRRKAFSCNPLSVNVSHFYVQTSQIMVVYVPMHRPYISSKPLYNSSVQPLVILCK